MVIDHGATGPDRPAVKDLDRDLTYAELRRSRGRGGHGPGGPRGGRGGPGGPPPAQLGGLRGGRPGLPVDRGHLRAPGHHRPRARVASILADCDAGAGGDIRRVRRRLRRGQRRRRGERSRGRTRRSTPGHGFPLAHCDCPEQSRPRRAVPRSGWPMPSTPREPRGRPRGCSSATAPSPPRWRPPPRPSGWTGTTRTLCVSPFHFDGSFGTLFPTLFSGGAVVIRPREALLFPRTFLRGRQAEAITYTGFSPSYLRLLLSSPQMGQAGRDRPRRGGPGWRGQLHRRHPGPVGGRPPGGGCSTGTVPPRPPSPSPTPWSRRSRSPGGRCRWDGPTRG